MSTESDHEKFVCHYWKEAKENGGIYRRIRIRGKMSVREDVNELYGKGRALYCEHSRITEVDFDR